LDPRSLVPRDQSNDQRSSYLIERCSSAAILTLWFSSLTKNGGRPRKASDKLWRIGLTPTVVEASDAWTFIQNERAKVVKERDEKAARQRKIDDAERKEVDRAIALENEKNRIKRA